MPAEPNLPPASSAKPPKERSETGHAGLVGLLCFIVLTALFLLPLLPGKTLDNFPGSSQSFSSGGSLACISTPTNQQTSDTTDTKAGFPLTYNYATSSHLTASCDSKTQSVVSGHTTQFNPLGLLIDVVSSLIIAVIVAKLWRKIFGRD